MVFGDRNPSSQRLLDNRFLVSTEHLVVTDRQTDKQTRLFHIYVARKNGARRRVIVAL